MGFFLKKIVKIITKIYSKTMKSVLIHVVIIRWSKLFYKKVLKNEVGMIKMNILINTSFTIRIAKHVENMHQ
ncbi:hypothetical protein [Clostridium estertheticum]|nr:hypothetical protein [Clostridium estertheticum]MBU3154790.1 hypothetical protein [Clostridium estertheticum]